MNIVVINHYAGSPEHGMEFRPHHMARWWRAAGHSVTVVAASHSHLRARAPHMGRPFRRESVNGIPYIWLWTPPYSGNGIGRAINMGAFVAGGTIMAGFLARELRPDVVVASSTYPLDILIANRIAERTGAAIVFEVHDLWPLSPIELGGMSPRHPFVAVMQWAEDRAYRSAARVVSMLPNAIEHMVEHGMDPGKFAYIPNGVDEEEWRACTEPLPEEHRAVLRGFRDEQKLIIGYAGAHGVANALETIVDAASLMRGERVAFVLVGSGPAKAGLRARAEQQKLKNLVFLPSVPRKAIPQLLASFDVCCITLRKQPLFRFGISPNKVMDYMMAGRPILQAVEASNDLVRASGSGISVPAEDAQSLAAAVHRFVAMPADERRILGERGREYVRAHHSYHVLASRFLSIFQAVAARGEAKGIAFT